MAILDRQFEPAILLADIFANQTLGYCLLIGLGILAILSMFLVWTRWGHAKPLSKCIALSIFAHILLGGYAYGTKLFFSYAETTKEEPVAFSVLEDDESFEEEIEPEKSSAEQSEKPWEKFAGEGSATPEAITHQKLTSHEAVIPQKTEPVPETVFQKHEIQEVQQTAVAQATSPELRTDDSFEIQSQQRQEVNPAQIANAPEPVKRDTPFEVPQNVQTQVERSEVPQQAQAQVPQNQVQPTEIDSNQLRQQLQNQIATQNAPYVPGPNLKDANTVPPNQQSNHPFRNASHGNRQDETHGQPQVTTKRRLADGQPIPKMYQNRFVENRALLIQQNGGSPDTEKAVAEALAWFSQEQSEDGRWNPRRFNAGNEANVYGHNRGGAGFNADTGITGLVILAYLGAGHTHLEGKFQKTVQKGLEYLIRTQNDDGSLYGEAGLFARTYCHGMALMAISEAYAITGDHRIKPFIIKGQEFTVATQNQRTGGWRYRPGDDGDMSQFGWQVMALKSAEQAGVPIPRKTKTLMARFLNNYQKGDQRGLASYRPAEKPTRTMTAEALFCRRLLNLQVTEQMSREAVGFVMEELPGRTRVDNLYYWYYATLSLHEEKSELRFQNENWQKWNRSLNQRLLALQKKSGDRKGSFSEDTLWSAYGGTFYSTAISTLCLEACYRYQTPKSPAGRTARR